MPRVVVAHVIYKIKAWYKEMWMQITFIHQGMLYCLAFKIVKKEGYFLNLTHPDKAFLTLYQINLQREVLVE